MHSERPTTDMRNRILRDRENRRDKKTKHKITKTKYSFSEIRYQEISEKELAIIKNKNKDEGRKTRIKSAITIGLTIILFITITLYLIK